VAGTDISLTTSVGPNKTITIAFAGTIPPAMTCIDVKDCIEAFTTLNLGGDITFQTGTTIDWTNTTNTGTQDFNDLYIANYD